MLENGLDFILDAAKQLRTAEETKDDNKKRQAIKYSLLHLLSGVELVMKHRLFIENWAYVFSDINKAKRADLKDGRLKTVEYSKCIERLENLCGVELTDDDKRTFEDLRVKRNCIEHFKTSDTLKAIYATINRALTATLRFLKENTGEFENPSIIDIKETIPKGLSGTEKKLLEEIITIASTLEEHHQDAIKLASGVIEQSGLCTQDEIIECPSCKERFLVPGIENERCRCFLCGFQADGKETASQYLSNVEGIDGYRTVKYGGVYPLYICPDCGRQSFIRARNKYICFSCRAFYRLDEISFCSECGEAYCKVEDDCGLCHNCIQIRIQLAEKD